jgi:xanthine/CO dehydrogenase XdhC/CoxF family maturation factor
MSKQSAFEAWSACVEAEQAGVLATILHTGSPLTEQESGRLFISDEVEPIGDLGEAEVNEQIIEIASQKLKENNPKSETVILILSDGKEISIFIDVYMPPIELMIFGAGHDAIPVANYSVSLGLKTTIVDSRSFYNSEERFPGTHRIVTSEETFQDKLTIGNRTHIIVMNHHLEKDQETLKFVLNSSSPYVGLLGPRSRRMRMLDGLKESGVVFSEQQLARLYSPIGLDIGAQTSEEIAISILTEVIAVKNGHRGGFLQGSEVIHHHSLN